MKKLKGYVRSACGRSVVVSRLFSRMLCMAADLRVVPYPKDAMEQIGLFRADLLERAHARELKSIKRDLVFSRLRYSINYSEYFLYDFPRLSDEGRRSFCGFYERRALCEKIGTPETREVLNHKIKTYEKFKAFYHRDAVFVRQRSDYDRFLEFIRNNDDFMVKPEDGRGGDGIRRVQTDDADFDPEALFSGIIDHEKGAILEGRIKQSEIMASFHPDSVNTVRVGTLVRDNHVEPLFSFAKFGRGGNCVDNGAGGGILASVDIETGVIKTAGKTESCEQYLFHPDTGRQIIGFQIPEWKELIDLVKTLALMLPEQFFIGWDMAHTDQGWVLVEGNRLSPFFGNQFVECKGYRDAIEATIRAELVRRHVLQE